MTHLANPSAPFKKLMVIVIEWYNDLARNYAHEDAGSRLFCSKSCVGDQRMACVDNTTKEPKPKKVYCDRGGPLAPAKTPSVVRVPNY
jgi:hypothetical protein